MKLLMIYLSPNKDSSFFIRDCNMSYYGEETKSKEELTMLELMVFAVVLAVTLVMSNYIMYVIMMKKFMNKETLKHYTKMSLEIAKELEDEELDKIWGED